MPACGRDAGRDAERHRQRQGDDADGQAGHQVGREGPTVVADERVEEFGSKGLLPA